MKFLLWATLLAAQGAFAQIYIAPTIRDISIGANCEETGIPSFTFNGDAFPTASPGAPVYLLVTLGQGVILCDTLVDFEGVDQNGNTHQHRPIYLPLRIVTPSPDLTLNAPGDAVSVARWIAGENAIWLQVTRPTSSWLWNGATQTAQAPTADDRVRFQIGLTAANSYYDNVNHFIEGRANLTASTWDLQENTEGYAISTLICVDLRESSLEPLPAPIEVSGLFIEVETFDHQTMNVTTAETPAGIIPGDPLPTLIAGDNLIGRAYETICALSMPALFFLAHRFCPDHPVSNTHDPELMSLSASLEYRVGCSGGWGWHKNSKLIFTQPKDQAYGLLVDVDGQGDPIVAYEEDGIRYFQLRYLGFLGLNPENYSAVVPESDVFLLGQTLLAKSAILIWGGTGTFGQITLDIFAEIYTAIADPVTIIEFDIQPLPTNRDHSRDNPPFNGTGDDGNAQTGVTAEDQARFCPPGFLTPEPLQPWYAGPFLDECTHIEPIVSDFFLGVPRGEGGGQRSVSLIRDLPTTQHISLEYTTPGSTPVFRSMAIGPQRKSFVLTDIAWFDSLGNPVPFPGDGGILHAFSPQRTPFQMAARLDSATGGSPLALAPISRAHMESELFYLSADAVFDSRFTNLLTIYNAGKSGQVALEAYEYDGGIWQANIPNVPANGSATVDLSTLGWGSLNGNPLFGDQPMVLALRFPHDLFWPALVRADSILELRFTAPVEDASEFFRSERLLPLVPAVAGQPDAILVMNIAVSPEVTGPVELEFEFRENPDIRWYVQVPIPSRGRMLWVVDQPGHGPGLYDPDTDSFFAPSTNSGDSTFADHPGMGLVSASAPIALETFYRNGSGDRRFYQPSYSQPHLTRTPKRVAYDIDPGHTPRLIVNDLDGVSPSSAPLLYLREDDGDFFRFRFSSVSNWVESGTLDEQGLTIDSGLSSQLIAPELVSGNDGVFFNSPAAIEANGHATLSLLLETAGEGSPHAAPFIQAHRALRGLLAFNGKPAFNTEQLDVISALPFFDFGVCMAYAFGIVVSEYGTTDADGLGSAALGVAPRSSAKLYDGSCDTEGATGTEIQQISFREWSVTAGPDQVLAPGTPTVLSANLDDEGFDPADFGIQWSTEGAMVGSSVDLNITPQYSGAYEVHSTETITNRRATDEVWVLMAEPESPLGLYLER